MSAAWSSEMYRQTAFIVLAALFLGGILIYYLRKKNHYFVVSWASIKSWLVVAPLLFIFLGLSEPWPLVVLTIIAILGAKAFFQIMGMFHRSNFVLCCYFGIVVLAVSIYYNRPDIYNLSPMIVLGLACLVPIFRNNYVSMIQYISLTNLAFVFLGWSFMHLGLIMKLEKGIYQIMYLLILTEFCDNTNLAICRYIGKIKLFNRIDYRRTLESTCLSAALTLVVASAMRFLLPDGSQIYWLTAGLVAAFGGMLGDMVMTVIRKDAGIKQVSGFVLGRGDFLRRMDRLIFVAPIYYYIMLLIPKP